MPTVRNVVDAMEAIAPPALALEGDPIGLLAGDPGKRVSRVTLALDASLSAVALAKRNRSQMLVVHHPRFYRPLKTVAETDPVGRRAAAIVRGGLAVYAAHTNLDIAPDGTNDLLARAAGLVDPVVTRVEKREALLKLAVFVPASHAERVLRALCGAGAGAIGKYSDCTFRTRGVGTFRGGEDTKPFIGRPGSFEEADEFRLETVFGEFARDAVLAAMREAHPYEEVAYDLYELRGHARVFGLGRTGDLAKPEPLRELAARLARATGSSMTQYHGRPGERIRRVAVWAGAGADGRAVVASGAQAVVAGEVGYHEVEAFADAGVAVIALGHGFSEELVLKPLARRLASLVPGVETAVAPRGEFGMRNV